MHSRSGGSHEGVRNRRTGFIGSHVVDLLLADGHSVRLLLRNPEVPEQWKGKDVMVVPGDLRDPGPVIESLQGVAVVFHIGEVRNTTAGNAAANVGLVERMVAALKPAGVKRLVFVSSLSVAGIPLAIPATKHTPGITGTSRPVYRIQAVRVEEQDAIRLLREGYGAEIYTRLPVRTLGKGADGPGAHDVHGCLFSANRTNRLVPG